ncbi:tyrosine--tRNA ligase [Patescibacteria group bacterium]|nr:tyrosine--tRNA ligase [Patescibacteria group bacterium]
MINTNQEKIKELLERGVDEVIEKESLNKKLKSGKQLRVKFGIDPTAPDLHLGHSVALRKLRQFQELGHKIVFLIGDFTATIGDPSGRTTQRAKLTEKQVKQNMKDYIKQAGKILDIKKTEIRYNNEWYKKKGAMFLMDLSSKFTLARVAERDDFKKRIKEDVDISMLELIYPLLQGYDSVELKSDVEIGGRDQKFNLLMGRKVQKRYNMAEQDIMTLPLLEGVDGVKKMSKSLGNYIGFTEVPFQMFGKVMSVPDELMWKYFNLLTDLSSEEIKKIKEEKQRFLISPRDIKARLAKEIVILYHGEKAAEKAEDEFNKVFRDKQAPTEISTIKLADESIAISDTSTDLVFNLGLADSKSEAKRLIMQGAVDFDGKVQTDWKAKPDIKKGMVIKVGRKKFKKII